MAAFVLAGTIPWHEGEEKMHKLMGVPFEDNPTVPDLRPGGGYSVQSSPLMAIGTLDRDGLPWTTVLGGTAGFAGQIGPSIIAVRNTFDRQHDPVVKALTDGKRDGEVIRCGDPGKLMAALPIDLENRKRVKLMGRMVAGCVNKNDDPEQAAVGLAQLVFKITSSLGNCPKYLNKKRIVPATPQPRLILDSPQLSQGAIDLLNHADTLFLSTSHHQESMDTNIRGGCRGFVRILSNDSTGAVLVYPEYSGNRLYQSLGNLQTTPRAGYVFPDFETGNVLYATGTTEILAGKDAAALLPRSNLAVKVTLTAARYVEKGLPFRGEPGEDSPYNPPLRYLSVEKLAPVSQVPQDNAVSARLVGAEEITPTISRFRFRISDPAAVSTWIPGQYAILDFKDELDMGYRHMEDLDPAVLNDDFIRTFTVSSHPGRKLPKNEFEITARISGRVTKHLSRSGDRNYMEVLLRGFNGDFRLGNTGENDATVGLVIGGIGITPVIAQLHTVNASRLRLYWSINVKDIALVHDIFEQFSGLQKSTTLFLTGLEAAGDKLSEQEHMTLKSVLDSGAQIKKCRLKLGDLDLEGTGIWYLCAGAALRKDVLGWLDGKRVVYEDFGY